MDGSLGPLPTERLQDCPVGAPAVISAEIYSVRGPMSTILQPDTERSPNTPTVSGDAIATSRPQILCVDDSLMMRRTLEKVLGEHFHVHLAEGSEAAVAKLVNDGPFAVVMSDLRMPGSDGLRLLKALRTVCPDTVRILYSGNMAVPVTLDAVNEAGVFRVMQTPFRTGTVLAAVTAAAQEHARLEAERVMLTDTVSGCLAGFARLIERTQPLAKERTLRVVEHVRALAAAAEVTEVATIETAAALIDIGVLCTAGDQPPEAHIDTDDSARTLLLNAADIIAPIAALSDVHHVLRDAAIDANETALDGISDKPTCGQILRIARDYEQLRETGRDIGEALVTMQARANVYSGQLMELLADIVQPEDEGIPVVEVSLDEVMVGMIFAADLVRTDGVLLIAKGQTVTAGVQERLRHQWAEVVSASTLYMHMPVIPDEIGV